MTEARTGAYGPLLRRPYLDAVWSHWVKDPNTKLRRDRRRSPYWMSTEEIMLLTKSVEIFKGESGDTHMVLAGRRVAAGSRQRTLYIEKGHYSRLIPICTSRTDRMFSLEKIRDLYTSVTPLIFKKKGRRQKDILTANFTRTATLHKLISCAQLRIN